MSQENVELVRQTAEAFNRGGLGAFLPFLDPQVEWHDLADQPDAGVHRGHQGVRYDRSQDDLRMPPAKRAKIAAEFLRAAHHADHVYEERLKDGRDNYRRMIVGEQE